MLLVTASFFLRRLRVGDTIVFQHKLYGTLIKRITAFDPETAEVYIAGTSPESLDSRRLGTIRRENIGGKVIARFAKR